MNPIKRTCLVVAPADLDIAPLLEALRSNRIEPFFVSDFLRSGRRLGSQVRAAFRSADFIIALLFSKISHRENVYFELGVAVGLAKAVFVFGDNQAGIDYPIRDIITHYIDRENLPSLIPIIERELAPKVTDEIIAEASYVRASERTLEHRPGYSRQALTSFVRGLKIDIEAVLSPRGERRLHDTLLALFRSAGLTIVEAPRKIRQRVRVPDFAIWIDDVGKEIGNPIAVELKPHLHDNNIFDAVNQLGASLGAVGASAGILLHTNRDLDAPQFFSVEAPIFVLSVQELAQQLDNETFSTWLKRARGIARGEVL